jgi:hypothetical protein
MHTVLHLFMKTVFEQLPPPLLLKDTNKYQASLRLAKQLSEQLPLLFFKRAFTMLSAEQVGTLVQNCHNSICLITGQIEKYAGSLAQMQIIETAKQDLTAEFAQLQTACREFFAVLQKNYGEFLRDNQVLPMACWQAAQPVFLQQAKQILQQILGKPAQPLIQAAFHSLLPVIDGEKSITLHAYRYWQQLLPVLIKQTPTAEKKENARNLLLTLLRYNCNCEYTLCAALPYIAATLPECDSREEMLAQWQQVLKQVQRIQPIPGLALHTGLPDAKTQMISYLEEEITEHRQGIPAPGFDQPENRLQFDLSVAQLALFIRLLVQVKLVTVTNQEAFLKQVSSLFLTRKGVPPLHDTLRARYFAPSQQDQHTLKDIVMQMLQAVRSI